MTAQVGIIGGGLAGLALSIELARAGVKVTLIEKNRFPFHKVCGEYISNESRSYLRHLGINLEELGARNIHRFRLSHHKGAQFESNLGLGGIGISRYTLDSKLADIAKAEGVELLDGTKVTGVEGNKIQTQKEIIECKIVIGAHGKRSVIDKSLKRDFIERPLPASENYLGVKYHVHADLPKDLIELHLFPHGYFGISAVEGDAYCMCYLNKASNLKKGMTITDLEREVLSENPVLNDYLNRFTRVFESPEVISQINFQNKEKHRSGIFFAGDAAGLIAPLSGNGMSMALHSAHLLSKLVIPYLNGKLTELELEYEYLKAWNGAFSKRFYFSRFMQSAFFNPVLMPLIVRSANLFPILGKTIINSTHGSDYYLKTEN